MSKITFSPAHNWIGLGIDTDVLLESIPHPVPAAKMIPDYYKSISSTVNQLDGMDYHGLQTLKKCMPFLDPMTTGYIIPAWTDFALDVGVNGTGEILPLSKFGEGNGGSGDVIDKHAKEQLPYHPFEKVYPYSETILKFMSPWNITTPKGYSCLFTSPFNHLQTDVKILDGIVDTDDHKLTIHFPFIWTGFESGMHVIEKGTPLIQVFPFKRESLKLDVRLSTKKEVKDMDVMTTRYITTIKDFYMNHIWSKRKK